MRCTTWLPVLVLLAGLGIGREVRADAKMDWSDYLEPAGSRPAPVKAAAAQRPAKATASQKKVSRSVAKKRGAESRSKKKAPVRSKRRR